MATSIPDVISSNQPDPKQIVSKDEEITVLFDIHTNKKVRALMSVRSYNILVLSLIISEAADPTADSDKEPVHQTEKPH